MTDDTTDDADQPEGQKSNIERVDDIDVEIDAEVDGDEDDAPSHDNPIHKHPEDVTEEDLEHLSDEEREQWEELFNPDDDAIADARRGLRDSHGDDDQATISDTSKTTPDPTAPSQHDNTGSVTDPPAGAETPADESADESGATVDGEMVARSLTGDGSMPTPEAVQTAYGDDKLSDVEMEAAVAAAIRHQTTGDGSESKSESEAGQQTAAAAANPNPDPDGGNGQVSPSGGDDRDDETAPGDGDASVSTTDNAPATDSMTTDGSGAATPHEAGLLNDDNEFPWEEEVISESDVGEQKTLKFTYKQAPIEITEPENQQRFESHLSMLEGFEEMDAGKRRTQAQRYARKMADDVLTIDGHPHDVVYLVTHANRKLLVPDPDGSKGLDTNDTAKLFWQAMTWYDRMRVGQRMGEFVMGDEKFRRRLD